MGPFHPALKDATNYIREAGKSISPTNLLEVSSLGEKCTVSDLAPYEKPNTCMIVVFNMRYRKTFNLEHQDITYTHVKSLLKRVDKGIYFLSEALHQANKKIKIDLVN